MPDSKSSRTVAARIGLREVAWLEEQAVKQDTTVSSVVRRCVEMTRQFAAV